MSAGIHCRDSGDACRAGTAYAKGSHWEALPQEPSERIGRRLFGELETDDSLLGLAGV